MSEKVTIKNILSSKPKNSQKKNFKKIKYIPFINVSSQKFDEENTTDNRTIQKSKIEKIKIFSKKYREIFILLCSILSLIFYILSLEGCYGEVTACAMNDGFFYSLIRKAVASYVLINIVFFLIFYTGGSKKHLIYLSIIYGILFYLRHGGDFIDHGLYNIYLFIICLVLGQIICSLLMFNFKIIIKYHLKFLILLFLEISLVLSIKFFYINPTISCKNWAKGLNNTYMNNDKNIFPYTVKMPKKCYINLFDGLFDMSILMGFRCDKRKSYTKYLLRLHAFKANNSNINKNTIRIGYPITANNIKFKKDLKNFDFFVRNEFYQNLIDMDNVTQTNNLTSDPEVIIDYTKNQYGDLKMNVHFNKTLSDLRKSQEINTKPLYKNILMVYVDGVSRPHFLRKFKKTSKFISQFIEYNNTSKFQSFQFFKVHSYPGHTVGNLYRMIYGKPVQIKKSKSIIHYFKENGFITAQVNDFCSKEPDSYKGFYYKQDQEREYEEFDHEFITLDCDPNYEFKTGKATFLRGYCAVVKRCVYGKQNVDYFFEYAAKFWETYKTNRKFLKFHISTAHESTGEVVKYTDEPLYNFITNLYEKNLLDDTLVLFSSDHGLHMPTVHHLLNSEDYENEKFLPHLFAIVSKKNDKSYEEQFGNIYDNQQNFITTMDMYNTFSHVIYGDQYYNLETQNEFINTPKSKDAYSIFEKIPRNRNCENYGEMNGCCRFELYDI